MSVPAGWSLEGRGGIRFLRCDALIRTPGLTHVFSTRCGDGGSDFDLGGAEPPVAPDVIDRRRRLLAAAGFEAEQPTVVRQVHGNRILCVAEATGSVEADAVLWTAGEGRDRAPAIRTADCVPILLAALDGRAAVAVHAGWRGTAAGVAVRAVDALRARGVEPDDLTAALGPAIRPCCYPVGPDTARAVAESVPGAVAEDWRRGDGTYFLDLHEANRGQLAAAGVPVGRIHAADLCTSCRADLFFSFRRDRGRCGRMMAAVGPGRP